MLKRIDAVDPREGEYDELAADLSKVEHAEALALAADAAHEALAGESGALDALGGAVTALDGAARFDARLGEWADALREAGYVLEDMARETRAYRDEVEFDPEALARQQERMADLQGLLRAYGPRMEDVLARRAEAADLVSLVDDAAARERAAQKALDAAEEALAQAARVLDEARLQAAPRFGEAVTAQMARLEMGGAQLVCAVEPLERAAWTRTGPSSVEYLFRPGAGMQARPLARIASGGEVSRVMLAVKVVLGAVDEVDTLVFDEVDAGVGGATAVALADVLADLARTHQVIVVTHLAQVAVRGEAHYVVRKAEGESGMPETDLQRLSAEERPAEIAACFPVTSPRRRSPMPRRCWSRRGWPDAGARPLRCGRWPGVSRIARALRMAKIGSRIYMHRPSSVPRRTWKQGAPAAVSRLTWCGRLPGR